MELDHQPMPRLVHHLLPEYLDYTVDQAEEIASKFKGFGPRIYRIDQKEQVALLSIEGNGRAVYSMLLGKRDEEGPAPKNLKMKHWS
jgi:hypothetical protein